MTTRIKRRQDHLDDNVVQDDFLPMYQTMIRELGRAPNCARKAKVYIKAVLVFVALVLYWYAVYELLGYMVIQRVVSRIERAHNEGEVIEEEPDDDEDRYQRMLEGWTTLALGLAYFLLSVCALIFWQEFTCERHSPDPDEDRILMLEDDHLEHDDQAPRAPPPLAPTSPNSDIPMSPCSDLPHRRHDRCCATARRGWQTPPARVLQWNVSCMLGVIAWMGLDLTCDAIHLLIRELDKTRGRLGINIGFFIAANVIVITLQQIPTGPEPPRRRHDRAKASASENSMRTGGASLSSTANSADSGAAERRERAPRQLGRWSGRDGRAQTRGGKAGRGRSSERVPSSTCGDTTAEEDDAMLPHHDREDCFA